MPQFKTLQFPNTPQGQTEKIKTLEIESAQGWRVISETIVPGKFKGEKNPCWKGGSEASNKRERWRLREKRAELKRRGIEYLGGKCIECGYDRCIAGLDFHHPDPTKKDPDFSKKCETTWAKMKPKIKGCVVICCRCHREIHAGLHDDFIKTRCAGEMEIIRPCEG